MFSTMLEACADSQRLVAVGPPGAGGCVSGSLAVAIEGSARRARDERRGDGSATVYVLDPAWGPVGRPRYRRELVAHVTAEQSRALTVAGAVTRERAEELLAENRRPSAE